MRGSSDHIFAVRIKDNKVIHIDKAPLGKKCGCICSKCKQPLIAKNGGKKNIHHFAHTPGYNCNGESLAHIYAKDIIKNNKYLYVPTKISFEQYERIPKKNDFHSAEFLNLYDPRTDQEEQLKKVDFNAVKIEALIPGSKYIADLICKSGNHDIVVEIVVSHDLDTEKANYLIKNHINTLIINLKDNLDNDEYNDPPNNFSDLVLKTSERKWFVQKELENAFLNNIEKLKLEEIKKEERRTESIRQSMQTSHLLSKNENNLAKKTNHSKDYIDKSLNQNPNKEAFIKYINDNKVFLDKLKKYMLKDPDFNWEDVNFRRWIKGKYEWCNYDLLVFDEAIHSMLEEYKT